MQRYRLTFFVGDAKFGWAYKGIDLACNEEVQLHYSYSYATRTRL